MHEHIGMEVVPLNQTHLTLPHDGTTVVNSRSKLEAMAADWDVLAESFGVPMLSHAWIVSCAESFYADDELHVITVRVGGKLAGVAPLVRRERAGVTRLELIGASELYEPSGLLYDTPHTLDLLLRAIATAGRPVLLSRIPTHSHITSRLRSVVRGPSVMLLKPGAGTLAVPISIRWSEFLERTSSRHRSDLRRARRRAEASGNVTFRINRPRPDQVAGMLAELVRIESTGWKTRHGSSLHQRHALRRFFLNYATRAAQRARIQFGFLDVSGQPIASQLAVEYADRLWLLKIGYDDAWRRCSPGALLLAETLRDAFDRKLKSYEFLGIDEPWLHRWPTETTGFSTAACYPRTLLGWYCLLADMSRRVLLKVGRFQPN